MVVNIAVIGAGNMGRHHARVYAELKGVNLVAIADLDEAKAKEVAKQYNCKYYVDYKKMLTSEKIDGVSIVVPTKYHKDVALECMNQWKNVLIEKPIADTLENAEEIIHVANKKKIKLLIGHIERHNPAVKKLREIISSGKLGNIVSISAKRVGLFPPQITDVDVVSDLAVHDIDIINSLIGKLPSKISAHLSKALNTKMADCVEILMEYNGTAGIIQANWVTPVKIRQLSVTGTKGYAELDYITQKLVLFESRYQKEFSTFGELVKFSQAEAKEIMVKNEEPLKVELEHFVRCIEKTEEPIVTGKDAIDALRIAIKISGELK